MTIIRISHNKENPFITVSKKILDLETLSWEAKGLWTYLMGRPDNWNLHVEHLTKYFPAGRDKTLRILKELIDHQLCFWYQERLHTGILNAGVYVVFESQNSEEFIELERKHILLDKNEKHPKKSENKGSSPCPEKPCPVKPDTGMPTTALYSNKHSSKEELNERNKTPISPKRGLRSLRDEKRKTWALSNESKGQCGYSLATEEGYEIVSGSHRQFYPYGKRCDFWSSKGL